MLMLDHRSPLVSGANTDVYSHPDDADLLIKLPRAAAIERAKTKLAFWYGHERRYRHLKNMLRSVREQIALYSQTPNHSAHLERIVGFVETDRGVGLVVEAVRQADGGLAPTLSDLVRSGGFDEAAERHLRVFCDWMIGSPIVVNDFSVKNLVYAQPAGREPCFVLIDGYGETAAIPLKSWINWLNRRMKVRNVQRLYRALAVRLERAQPVQPFERGDGSFAQARTAATRPQG